jgi:ATP-dependent protease HslVU (ClpYQ) peptidase subunit
VSLAVQHLEARVRDLLGGDAADARRQDEVALAGEDQRRRGDLRKAAVRVVREARADLRLERLHALLVTQRSSLSTWDGSL